jgi:hypothetical protein
MIFRLNLDQISTGQALNPLSAAQRGDFKTILLVAEV